MKNGILIVFISLLLMSCNNEKQKDVISILQKWQGKEVQFPNNMIFTRLLEDTVIYTLQDKYKIVMYADSVGCVSCKLQLEKWKQLMTDVDSLGMENVQFLFFFSSGKRSDIYKALRTANFEYPICLDEVDSINKLNHFPSDIAFQTFLLDKDNRVVAIGNPVHNSKIKELYLSIIQGNTDMKKKKALFTKIQIDTQSICLGNFAWQEKQRCLLILKNIGDAPLVIQDVNTSCGCIFVSYSKKPVDINKTIELEITYKAEHPEHFNKTITVYCNTEDSPIHLSVSGNAE